MNVVEKHGHAVAWSFSQPDIAGYDRLKDLSPEKTPKIGSYLLGKCSPVVVHREEDAFDGERWVDRPPEAHQRI